MSDVIQSAYKILSESLREFHPSLIVLSYSGGYDSAVSSHLTWQWAKQYAHSCNVITVSVDTLLSADGWTEYVRSAAQQMRLPRFEIRATSKLNEWLQRCAERGFPFNRSQHKISFYYLKQTVFREVLASHKKYRTDRVLFVDGVRRAESVQRKNSKLMYRQGSMAHVSPLVYWTDDDIETYRYTHNLPDNPFYDELGNSGDCLCNWHRRLHIDELRIKAPEAYQRIKPVHDICMERWKYGYGHIPPPGAFSEGATQETLPGIDDTPFLCADCEKPKPDNESRASMFLQRMNWDDS